MGFKQLNKFYSKYTFSQLLGKKLELETKLSSESFEFAKEIIRNELYVVKNQLKVKSIGV